MEMDKFDQGNQRFLESKNNNYYYKDCFTQGLGAFITLITIVVIVSGAVMMTKEHHTGYGSGYLLLYINNFTEPIRKLINFTEQFQNGMSGFERFLEVLAVEPDIADKPGLWPYRGLKVRSALKTYLFITRTLLRMCWIT